MKKWRFHLVGVVAAASGILAAATLADAETCTLELKRLGPRARSGVVQISSPLDYIYRATSSQSFFMQVGIERPSQGAKAFSEIVKKEPAQYQSEHPFRGVAKLGSQQYAFVLDSAAPEPSPTAAKPDSTSPKKDAAAPGPQGYTRLHFDLNHNGDLTDDKVIEAEASQGRYPAGYSRHEFPRVDLTIDVDGTQVDYAFFFSVFSQTSGDFKYASASLSAAAYREGEVTLDGKPRRVVLLDFNSNGRFDDQFKVLEGVRTPGGEVYPQYGDMLLVDPNPSRRLYRSPYDPTTSDDQHYVSKLVNIDGSFYDVKISPAGDSLTLTSSSAPLGQVTNANEGFCAVVYGDRGFLKISGGKSEPVLLPEGDWKLLSYTIDQTGQQAPAEKEENGQKGGSLLGALAQALTGAAPSMPLYTVVSARATKDFRAVEVRKGQTVALPFGPPYKAVVKAGARVQAGQQTMLAMSLVGSAGEVCSNLMVNGRRPDEPTFTISTPDGEEVDSGKFEWG